MPDDPHPESTPSLLVPDESPATAEAIQALDDDLADRLEVDPDDDVKG